VTRYGRDAVAGEAEQTDAAESTERARLDALDVIVVEQDDGQVRSTGERVGVDDGQLTATEIKHLHVTSHHRHCCVP